jgi:hypothetical protein
MSSHHAPLRADTAKEVEDWFFRDYLSTWIAAGADGASPDFISTYWGHPLHVCTDGFKGYKAGADDVVGFLDQMHSRLRSQGYSTTRVLDRRIRIYNERGASIEVIWSRQRADASEIERIAVHFEVSKLQDVWRVASIQSTHTQATTLDEAWSDISLAPL